MPLSPCSYAFLDFEASSLEPDSWPIEWGVSFLRDNGGITTRSQVITPHPSWSMTAWRKESERVHGLSHGALIQDGVPADEAARALHECLKGKTVVSDAPAYERLWISKLFAVVGLPIPSLMPLHWVFWCELKSQGQDVAFECVEKSPKPHRAGPDSALMAKALRKGLDVDTGRRPYGP